MGNKNEQQVPWGNEMWNVVPTPTWALAPYAAVVRAHDALGHGVTEVLCLARHPTRGRWRGRRAGRPDPSRFRGCRAAVLYADPDAQRGPAAPNLESERDVNGPTGGENLMEFPISL
jgi:hypothetical protein